MKQSRLFSYLLSMTVIIMTATVAHANVSLKNGNFFVGYTDLLYSGGFEPKIERVYNSKSPYHTGMFGWGWGTEYEVSMTVHPDGSVVVNEYGGGAQNRFVPKGYQTSDLNKAVAQIVGVAKKLGTVGSQKQLDEYQKRLMSDAVFRNDEWQKFVNLKKLTPVKLPVNTQLISNRFSYQYITKVNGGYKRSFDNGKLEVFSDDGKLLQVTDKNNNYIKFTYAKDGKLAQIIDNFNRKMFFSYNSAGLVEKITDQDGKYASYQYNPLRELTASRDAEGNVYQYSYTKDKRHNMEQITYSDKTTMNISYHDRSQRENVRRIQDRDGTITEYTYSGNPEVDRHYQVKLVVKDKKGKALSNSSYEYTDKVKKTGEIWTWKMVTTIDKDRTETVYNECCGLPVMIKRGSRVTQFKYDPKGRVTFKDNPSERTQLQYHSKFGKVTYVKRYSKLSKKTDWSKFQYDSKANLIAAQNSDKRSVRLVYDRFGRISSMIDQNKKVLKFKYNEHSKPIEIQDPKLGTIKVSYTNTGEIKRVDSTAGRKIALEVTSSFQNLLDIIRPAGVSLSF